VRRTRIQIEVLRAVPSYELYVGEACWFGFETRVLENQVCKNIVEFASAVGECVVNVSQDHFNSNPNALVPKSEQTFIEHENTLYIKPNGESSTVTN
jgi:hypothetical protein